MSADSDSFVSGTESESFPVFSPGCFSERPDSSRIFVFVSLLKQIYCNNSRWKGWIVSGRTHSPKPERPARAEIQSETGQKQDAYSLSLALRESAK
ncbi:hypothetical protein [uncultured Gimesia sp.]|uniref:hypothetical protein n=1 Tax=uncultured Gimesia sp. TaxID=1678688 RepID=UPI00262DE91D|nr:hypothetical protein [uncultured Gimesia sp.]